MKTRLMTAVGCGAILLMLGACDSRAEYRARKAEREALKVVSKLDCPETQGNLKRTAVAADGQSCTYGGEGSEVVLKLVAVSNDPAKALDPIQAEVRGLFPAEPATPETPTPPAKPGEPAPEPKKTGTTKERVSMPGLTVETEEGENVDKAKVRMPGLSVDSDGDNTRVKIMGVEVNANESQAEVVMVRERWPVDDGDFEISVEDGKANISSDGFTFAGKQKRGYRSTFVKTTKNDEAPWNLAGWEAQGPLRGPLVVAVVKSKRSTDPDAEAKHLFRDATALVKKQFGE